MRAGTCVPVASGLRLPAPVEDVSPVAFDLKEEKRRASLAQVNAIDYSGSMAMTVGNLSLSSAAVAYMQLVKVDSTSNACMGKTRVVPGDPANSLLVQKLRGANVMCGGAMPVGADEITDAEQKRITDWISAGACNN